MHLFLFLLCIVALIIVAGCVLSRRSTRKELVLIFLSVVFLAYPVKGYLLHFEPSIFATYDGYQQDSDRIEVYFAFIAFVFLFAAGYQIPRSASILTKTKVVVPSEAWGWLNLINALALLMFVFVNTNISSVFDFLSSAARQQFLASQVGSGWSSLLIVFTIPLLVLAYKTGKWFIFYLAFVSALISLLIIGSRIYLFGYVITFFICRFRPSLQGTALMLFVMSILGTFIYMGFLGDTLGEVDGMLALSFLMHTFDGADLLNTYINKGQHQLYFGMTFIEELFITYFPRALWEGKPYLFGAVRITTDMFTNLQNFLDVMATFPPGIFLEIYANFSVFSLVIVVLLGMLFAWVSDDVRIQSPFYFALYVSLCANAPGFFRGIGSIIVFILPVIFLLGALSLAKRIRVIPP